MLCLWPSPPWFNQRFPLTVACSGGLAKSTLSFFLCLSDRFDFVFSLRCIELGSHFYVFCIKVISGPRVKVYSERPLTPTPNPHPRQCILLTVLRRWSRCCSYSVKSCSSLHYEALHVCSCKRRYIALLFVYVFLLSF